MSTSPRTELLDRTQIILIEPNGPDNVGSIARAMANLGLSQLVIAGSPGIKEQPGARKMAVSAADILEGVVEVPDFAAATRGAALVFGTTSHAAYETWQLLSPAEALALAKTTVGAVSIVFGCERYGLSKSLLRKCDQVIHLKTAKTGKSLNLAQAVLLLAWEWYQNDVSPQAIPKEADATTPWPTQIGRDWATALEAMGVLKPHNRDKKLATLRQLVTRVRLTREEAALMRQIGSKLNLFLGLRGPRK